MFSGSQTWSRTVSSQSGISWVLYNLYPGLSQDDSVGPSPQESIQSVPTLATQSGARSHDPGLRFIQDWGGPHIGFLVPWELYDGVSLLLYTPHIWCEILDFIRHHKFLWGFMFWQLKSSSFIIRTMFLLRFLAWNVCKRLHPNQL